MQGVSVCLFQTRRRLLRPIRTRTQSGTRSDLRGALEVFGARASLIIANPSGITCDGCGSVNVSRVALLTGKITLSHEGVTALTNPKVEPIQLDIARLILGVALNWVAMENRNSNIGNQGIKSSNLVAGTMMC